MAHKKSATVSIAGYSVWLDAEDAERVKRQEWKVTLHNNLITLYRETRVRPDQVYNELLQHFIMQVPASRYVELIDRSPKGQFDLRKKNLRLR